MFTGQHKQRSRKIKLVLDGHGPTPHEKPGTETWRYIYKKNVE